MWCCVRVCATSYKLRPRCQSSACKQRHYGLLISQSSCAIRSGGLSGGAIAGIVIVALAVMTAIPIGKAFHVASGRPLQMYVVTAM